MLVFPSPASFSLRLKPSSWRVALIIVFMTAGYSVSFVSPVVYAEIAGRLGLSPTATGYIAAFELAFTALGNLVAPILAGRIRARSMGLIAVAGFIVANLGSTLPCTTTAILLLRALSGLAEGIIVGIGSAFIAQTGRPERTYALVLLAGGMYAAIANPSLSVLVDAGWGNAIFLAFVAWAIVAAVALCRLTMRDTANGSFGLDASRASQAAPRAGMTRTDITVGSLVLVGLFLFMLASMGFWPFVKMAAYSFGQSSQSVSIGLGVYSLTGVATALAIGLIGHRLHPAAALCFGLLLAGCAPLILLAPRSSWAFISGLVLYAMSWNIVLPFVVRVLSRIDPSGRLNSLAAVVNTVSYSLGAAAVAFVVGKTSYGGLRYFLVGLTIAAAVVFLAVLRATPAASHGATHR